MQASPTETAARRGAPATRAPVDDAWNIHGNAARGDHYEVIGELATGGMATVYLGRLRRSMGFSRLVAIKCMHPQYAKDPEFATMFVDEARLTARLRHPNIVPTLDIALGDGHLLIVMEYVEGASLAGLVRAAREAGEPVPVPVACAIVHDVLLGLHAAHEAVDDDGAPLAIVHRDVSPHNVMIGVDGLARVLDFGVAKARSRAHHSHSGEIKGKIPYMPPEQLFGEPIDRRVDVYAAGILLWESITGTRLFDGTSEELLVRRISEGTVAAPSELAPSVPAALDALVLRALSREARDRFPTALAMAEALAAITPLPTRTEVAACVKRFARPAVVRTAPAKRTIADLLASRETPEIVATLDGGAGDVPTAPNAFTGTPRPQRSRLGSALIAGAGAALVTLACAATAMSYASARGVARRPSGAARVAEETISPRAGATITIAIASTARATAATTLRPAAFPPAPRPATESAPPKPAEAPEKHTANQADAAKRASCRPPYVFDAEGRRHYRVECL
jgi:serine/threonine-protein kinase